MRGRAVLRHRRPVISRDGAAGRSSHVRPSLPPFQAVLDANRVAVWRFLVASVGRHDAADCFQETMISALRAYPSLRSDANLRGWLFTIAHNKVIDLARARGRRPVPTDSPPEQAVDDDAVHAAIEANGDLWAAVGHLPPKQRMAVVRSVRQRPALRRHRVDGGRNGSGRPPERAGRPGNAAEGGHAMTSIEQMLRGGPPEPDAPDLEALARRAEADDLVDVAWTTTDSPVGELFLAATPGRAGAAGVHDRRRGRGRCARGPGGQGVAPGALALPSRLDPVRRQLDEYFDGRRATASTSRSTGRCRTGSAGRRSACSPRRSASARSSPTRSWPSGRGARGPSRAAGSACATNPIAIVVPCHRVIRTGGGLGGYGGGLDAKRLLLTLEGSLLT